MTRQADRCYRWLFWCLALVGFALDQGSKYAIFAWLYNDGQGGYYPLLCLGGKSEQLVPWQPVNGSKAFGGYPPNLSNAAFGLRAEFTQELDSGTSLLRPLRTWGGERLPHVNKGALFGWGNAEDGRDFNTAFLVISFAAAAAIGVWSVRRRGLPDRSLCMALGLILAGTLGNLYDRVVFSGVRDFLHWNYVVNWPVFNIADCCLVCGASFLLLQALAQQPQPTSELMASASAVEPAAPAGAVNGAPAANGQVPDASTPGNCGVC